MTMNSQWGGGGLNPPEPLPLGGGGNKSMRDPGFIGGGLPSAASGNGSGRQITKNPLNMLGGLGSTSNGSYTNGSSSGFDQVVRLFKIWIANLFYTEGQYFFLCLLHKSKNVYKH